MKKGITVKFFSLVLVLAMVFAQIPAGMTAYAAEDPSQGATEYSDALFSSSNPNALGDEDDGTTFGTQNDDGIGGGGDIGNPGTGEGGLDTTGGGTGTGSGGTETGGNGSKGDMETSTDVPTNSDVPGGDTENENNGDQPEDHPQDANEIEDEEIFIEEEEEETVSIPALNAIVYDLWIGGEQVTSSNMSGTGWSFTPASGSDPAKLTLDNAKITADGNADNTYGIRSGIDPLVIELKGRNIIHGTSSYSCIGIQSSGKTTITGDGSLNINYYSGSVSPTYESIAIAGADLIVESGEIRAYGEKADSFSIGIRASSINIKGGTVVAYGMPASTSLGIDSPDIKIYSGSVVTPIGQTRAFSSAPDLSNYTDLYVEVSTYASPIGGYVENNPWADEWNGTDVLGGSASSFKWVRIGGTRYKLWIGEEQVTNNNLSGKGWEFTPASDSIPAKLTLNEAKIYSNNGPDYLDQYGIRSEIDPLVIELKGKNEIDFRYRDYDYSFGIKSTGETTITGDGSLTINVPDSKYQSIAINMGTIQHWTVESGTIYVSTGEAGEYSEGIWGRRINIKGGTVVASAGPAPKSSVGVSADVYMYGGRLTAMGQAQALVDAPNLSHHTDPYVQVNTAASADGASEWNGTDKLGGSASS